jgi:hypothetical protein
MTDGPETVPLFLMFIEVPFFNNLFHFVFKVIGQPSPLIHIEGARKLEA